MTSPTASIGVPVTPLGMVSGVAWVSRTATGMDLHVIGKLALRLEREGRAMPCDPEPPGYSLGRAAPEETINATGRRLVLRGPRAAGGRVMLRRGSRALVDVSFGPGVDLVHQPLDGSANTTMSGERGEWLVVEGGEHPQARRWCKLPKLGMVTTWRAGQERLVLTYKLMLVDLEAWSVSFVYRACKPLGATGMPLALDLSALDLEQLGAPRTIAGGLGSTMNLPDGGPVRPVMPFQTAPSSLFAPPPVLVTPSGGTGTEELVTTSHPRRQPESPPANDVRAELELRIKAGSSLAGLSLAGAKLEGIALAGARLAGLDLSMSDLRKADLAGADLSHAKLDDARFDGARLDGATLAGASLDRASFREASLRGVHAGACVGTEADFSNADLENADLQSARLAGARFTGARAQGLNAQEADLTGAVFSSARLEHADLRRAVLRRAQLKLARLTGCDLRDADLREIQGETALQGAKLAGARRS